ncbi:hypothetical protein [Caballeronia sp. NCTM5]|uniref:hypothetical protein n=1 Tax=Caballeronia sp. NCTM5 TaxID=2921755 RepID=UPI0020277367|nr:hypothetical protein [Caballeronia sp. NCTM5]
MQGTWTMLGRNAPPMEEERISLWSKPADPWEKDAEKWRLTAQELYREDELDLNNLEREELRARLILSREKLLEFSVAMSLTYVRIRQELATVLWLFACAILFAGWFLVEFLVFAQTPEGVAYPSMSLAAFYGIILPSLALMCLYFGFQKLIRLATLAHDFRHAHQWQAGSWREFRDATLEFGRLQTSQSDNGGSPFSRRDR